MNKAEFEKCRKNLYLQYVNDNKTHSIGDIITDGIHEMKIDDIGYRVYKHEVPTIVYYGMNKGGKRYAIFEENIVKEES